MPNSEGHSSRRALAISPNLPLLKELEALLAMHLGGGLQRLQAYPSPRELSSLIPPGSSHLVFLDMAADRDRGLELLDQLSRAGQHVQVIALLAGNDPDFILRCLRAGAVDFLIEPLTADQVEAAFGKLARLQTVAEVPAKEPARIIAVMPAKGACGATTVASSLAFQWKRTTGKKVLLADLDPLTGNLSFEGEVGLQLPRCAPARRRAR
jgi:pilus assembly protein CpaE